MLLIISNGINSFYVQVNIHQKREEYYEITTKKEMI